MKNSAVQCPILLIALLCIVAFPLQGCIQKAVEEEPSTGHIVLAAQPQDSGALGQNPSILTDPTPLQSTTETPVADTPDMTVPDKTPDSNISPDLQERFRTTIGKTIGEQAKKTQTKEVDLVLCLDTSDSMGVLIDSARKKLRDIASDIAGMKPSPRFRMALLAYGTPWYGRENGWVRIETDFTEDMNLVYSRLSNLQCHGGDEYVTRVVAVAMHDLHWNSSPYTLRTIFVTGNESACQDPDNDVRSICIDAAQRDIIINTIYCGLKEEPDASGWEDLAIRGRGKFTAMSLTENMYSTGSPRQRNIGFESVPYPLLPGRKKPEKKGGMIPLQGLVSGVVNNREILLREISGSASRTLTISSATRFSPASWRPSTGDYVTAYIDSSKPDKVKELDHIK